MIIQKQQAAGEEEQTKQRKETRVGNGIKVQGIIGKSELAQEIFPDMTPGGALNALRRAICNDLKMMEELKKTSYHSKCHVLTYQQSSIVKEHIYGTQKEQ